MKKSIEETVENMLGITEKPKALLLFSGGYDSVILLHELVDAGMNVHVMYVDYGQTVAQTEIKHFDYWVEKFDLQKNAELLTLPSIEWSKSTMLGGESTGDELKDEYVEMRNLIFLGYATSYAQAKGIKGIYAGFIHGEYYDDTNPLFVKAFDTLITATAGIEFNAPYVELTKGDITEMNTDIIDLEEVLAHSITCNTPIDNEPCGKCAGCKVIDEIKNNFLS
jgi:7-cyano-7-deazaguanine synthase